jgi:hypothetical protein
MIFNLVHLLIVQMIAELIRNKWGFYRDFSVTEVKHVLGILNVNSFVVHDGAEDGMDLIGKEMEDKYVHYSVFKGRTDRSFWNVNIRFP